jgi:ferrochelatase
MIGLLVMAYGGPNSLEEVEPYLLDVRGYRSTSQDIIHEVRDRYREIGGRSPILEQTQEQASAIESALNTNGQQFRAFVGMRHCTSKIALPKCKCWASNVLLDWSWHHIIHA